MAHETLDALRSALESHEDVLLAYVFGSVGRGDDSGESDVDVAILATHELDIEERSRLIERLGRATSFRRTVDVVDLRAAPPVLAAEVLRDGVLLLQRDPLVRFDFETAAVRRFEDTRALRRLQHELLREGARGSA